MKLTGQQIGLLHDALLDAFDEGELRRLVRIKLDKNLNAIAGGSNLSEIIFNLIEWAERTGRTADLIQAAASEREGNVALHELQQIVGGKSSATSSTTPEHNAHPTRRHQHQHGRRCVCCRQCDCGRRLRGARQD